MHKKYDNKTSYRRFSVRSAGEILEVIMDNTGRKARPGNMVQVLQESAEAAAPEIVKEKWYS